MVNSAFDKVTALTGISDLPVRLEQSTSRTSLFARLSMLLPTTLLLIIPMAWLAYELTANPGTMALLASRPLAALQAAFGIALLLMLFVAPSARLISRAWARRRIEIEDGQVKVEEHGLFGSDHWSRPVASYEGIAHHVRASLSGFSHEIVLVHADPHRSVTLHVGDRVDQQTIETLKRTLGLPEVPARLLYDRRARSTGHSAPVQAVAPTATAEAA